MKKITRVLGLALIILLVSAGSVFAWSYYQTDVTNSWPGYLPAAQDEYGTPKIASMTITADSDNYLTEIRVTLSYDWVLYPMALFINTNNPTYDAWNFYVNSDKDWITNLYSVESGYSYILAGAPYVRYDHPVAIELNDKLEIDTLNIFGGLSYTGTFSEQYGSYDLVYAFNHYKQNGNDVGILLENFTIGYTSYCANDVILTPEPSTLLLLGFGLLGLGIVRRKRD